MTPKVVLPLLLTAVLAIPVGFAVGSILSNSQDSARDRGNGGGGVYGVPGPVAGAGLPIMLVSFGAGAYWLLRRRRNTA